MLSPPNQPSSTRVFSETAVGAVVALIRVVELYDPAVAHRAALRATVGQKMLEQLPSSSSTDEQAEALAAAALADIDLAISRPSNPEAAHEPTRAMLGATLVGRLPGLRNVSTAIAHRKRRWDEGDTEQVPFAARLIAVTDCLVGNPASGFVPTWDHALRRVRRNRGSILDPQLCDALMLCDLDEIDASPIPSAAVYDLLSALVRDDREPGTKTATTIRTAVAAAGETEQLMYLFASTAQQTVNAAEVLIFQFAETHLSETPMAHATDGQYPLPNPDRLDDLGDFSTQAELRAGVTIAPSFDPSDPSDPSDEPGGLTNDVIVPIVAKDQPWGVLVASRRHDQASFDEHDLSILRHVASEAASAATSTTHWAEIEQMALRDQLTGLANRHALYKVLDAIFERPAIDRIDTALIMCDVDGLKVVNDSLGHQAGDRLLVDAAAALRGSVRDPERTTICRIGGDEFCMVIDGGALLTAHEISDMIERLFARSAGSGPPRSISCGIAFANDEIDSRSALLRAADENQYQTKRARKAQREKDIQALQETAGPPADRRAIRD